MDRINLSLIRQRGQYKSTFVLEFPGRYIYNLLVQVQNYNSSLIFKNFWKTLDTIISRAFFILAGRSPVALVANQVLVVCAPWGRHRQFRGHPAGAHAGLPPFSRRGGLVNTPVQPLPATFFAWVILCFVVDGAAVAAATAALAVAVAVAAVTVAATEVAEDTVVSAARIVTAESTSAVETVAETAAAAASCAVVLMLPLLLLLLGHCCWVWEQILPLSVKLNILCFSCSFRCLLAGAWKGARCRVPLCAELLAHHEWWLKSGRQSGGAHRHLAARLLVLPTRQEPRTPDKEPGGAQRLDYRGMVAVRRWWQVAFIQQQKNIADAAVAVAAVAAAVAIAVAAPHLDPFSGPCLAGERGGGEQVR